MRLDDQPERRRQRCGDARRGERERGAPVIRDDRDDEGGDCEVAAEVFHAARGSEKKSGEGNVATIEAVEAGGHEERQRRLDVSDRGQVQNDRAAEK